jgi:secondary thiamine-phosphate synthase enzyme
MIKTKSISLSTKGNTDIIDITDKVSRLIEESEIKSGVVTIFVPGSTGGLTTVEYEPGLIKDLKEVFEELFPYKKNWAHNATWGDGNGASHIRASMLGPSLTVPFVDGEMTLGTWQQIIFIDFDVRSRTRKLIVQIMGE